MPQTFRRLFEGPDEIDYAPDPMGRVGAGMQEIHDPTDDPRGNALFQDFREAWAEGRDLPELFGREGMLDIKEPVGPAARNRRPDVAKLETFLDALGEHDAARTDGPTGFYGIGFEDNLKAYQARNGLTPDGLVNPDGETIGRIKQDLTATLGPGALRGGEDGAEPGARLIPVQSTGRSPSGAIGWRAEGAATLS
jgi:peptidoglycan hydrolase-like protein with peptidoglycan-binding domain